MFANLFEHETLPQRENLNRIWDTIPASGSCAEIEGEFTKRAIAAGFSAAVAEQFLIGGDV